MSCGTAANVSSDGGLQDRQMTQSLSPKQSPDLPDNAVPRLARPSQPKFRTNHAFAGSPFTG